MLLARLSAAALADLLAPSRPTCTRERSVMLLRWCTVCLQWMREGSAAAGRCVDCGAPRPRHASSNASV